MYEFPELDEVTRGCMLAEFDAEQQCTDPLPYRPSNLTAAGERVFLEIMRQALAAGTEETLGAALNDPSYWIEEQVDRRGRVSRHTAFERAERFAKTDFNTWYIRGFARRLIDEGIDHCTIYRAAPAYEPRRECLALEGTHHLVSEVYAGHRARYHPVVRRAAFSIPVGPNCHHSIARI